eukprot:TRINITY_DN452_c0_g1_i1.p2 TRINITY_DN452_c0_g1~~TRINITY_DN452_c0_g1_i1.p2  ORF type:complete len:173 (-),score=56.01 TRINITY_DN452_c0_g1_i1:103-567(-)
MVFNFLRETWADFTARGLKSTMTRFIGAREAYWEKNTLGRARLVYEDPATGNRYFEDPDAFFFKQRWVEFKDPWGYDATDVPPEWHRWLHQMGDIPGHEAITPFFKPLNHVGNRTGTAQRYATHNHYLKNTHQTQRLYGKVEAFDPSTAVVPKQ